MVRAHQAEEQQQEEEEKPFDPARMQPRALPTEEEAARRCRQLRSEPPRSGARREMRRLKSEPRTVFASRGLWEERTSTKSD